MLELTIGVSSFNLRSFVWARSLTNYQKNATNANVFYFTSLHENCPYSELSELSLPELSLHIQSECGKMRTRIPPNTDTFHEVLLEFLNFSPSFRMKKNLFDLETLIIQTFGQNMSLKTVQRLQRNFIKLKTLIKIS